MATWREIGQDNFRAAVELYEIGWYRSAVSRFYYAALAVVTDELSAGTHELTFGTTAPRRAIRSCRI